VKIVPIENAQKTIKALAQTKGTAVTARLIIPASLSAEEAETMASDICRLLSLARGTQVSWISCDAIAASGEHIRSKLRDVVTRGYTPVYLIGPLPDDRTSDFVEHSYPRLEIAESQWDVLSVLRAYLDARVESDYLESRALKQIVCIEMLTKSVLSSNDSLTILPDGEFKEHLGTLRLRFRKLLEETYPNASPEAIGMMVNHVQGANWYPFRRSIKMLCSETGVSVNARVISRICDIRNSIVHYGELKRELGEPFEQYKLLDSFVGKTLVNILQKRDLKTYWDQLAAQTDKTTS
jgi:hypothetical protein